MVASSAPGIRLGLAKTRTLLALLGDPQVGMPGVLVAGTNGKGSVCAIAAEIASRAGLRVALLTKPHLTSYRERIRLGGLPIDEGSFAEIAAVACDAADEMAAQEGRPSHHELLTGIGFLAARQWGADLVVCEVGLGGRLDATNVWDGGIAIVTSIGLDHQAQLGNTIPEIAGEKAAIIKPGNRVVTAVTGSAMPPVEAAAAAAGAQLWRLGREILVDADPGSGSRLALRTPGHSRENLRLGLEGWFQVSNAALGVAAADCLAQLGFTMTEEAIRTGLAQVRWPGRMDTISWEPEVLVDAAHNPAAVEVMIPEIRKRLPGRSGVLLFGSMNDHDHRGMLELLARLNFQSAVFTRSKSARSASPFSLAGAWPGPAEVVEPIPNALARAQELAGSSGLVVSLGSIYVIGEVMSALGVGEPPDPEIPFPPLW